MTVPSFLILVAGLIHPVPPAGAHDSILLRVLAINDLHGALESRVQSWSNGRPAGGAAAIGGMMNRLAAECGCNSVRFDGGDVMQGSPASNLTFGRASVDAFGAMHIAASAIGNHEFDWTIDTLTARIHQARFAWLSANIRERATGRSPAWATPFAIVQAGTARVAVVGYTTRSTATSTNPAYVASLAFAGAAALDSAIAQAQALRPDFVIVVAHAGAFCNVDTGCDGEIVELARALTHRPDLIVSGHTHTLITTTVNGIPIVQARSNGTALGVVDFVATDTGRAVRMRVETVFADREQPDSAVLRIVTAAVDAVRPLTARPVATLAQSLAHADPALGEMVADALRESASADIGLVNRTGIRADLPAGPVTWGAVYEVLPFGNFVVKMSVPGTVLRQAIEHALAGNESSAAVSGLAVRVDRGAPSGHRVAALTLADGRNVQDEATYTLATFDFLAAGGSGYFMLRGLPFQNMGVDELDAFIAYLQRQPQPVRSGQGPPRISPAN